MELFVLGPAFGLPSIDAECAAAIALLQLQRSDDWRIVPTHNTDLHLPLLIEGDVRIAGYKNIARHLQKASVIALETEADATAITSFLEANAQTLLDISLYVSYENYSETTRPAFTKILPWNVNYMLPPKLRAAARTRTDHLGISSIDVDNVHEDMSNRPEGFDGVGKEKGPEGDAAQKRASLLLPRKDTLRSLLQRPEHAAAFKLHALADNFFAPLQKMLGEKQHFLGDEMTSVDCLAYGYLSLMLFPKMPQDWLAATMRKKYGKLAAYTERLHVELKMKTHAENVVYISSCKSREEVVLARKHRKMTLPWAPTPASSFIGVLRTTFRELLSHTPLLSDRAMIVSATAPKASFWQMYLPAILGLTATSMGLALYQAFTSGALVWPHGEDIHIFGRKRLADYGHLGSALAGISLLGQQASADSAFHAQEQMDSPVQVGVMVEGDSMP